MLLLVLSTVFAELRNIKANKQRCTSWLNHILCASEEDILLGRKQTSITVTTFT